jgi:hypothetical protein
MAFFAFAKPGVVKQSALKQLNSGIQFIQFW